MSKEYPTVNETIAYEGGFADAKDYWVAKEQERIIKLLTDKASNTWAGVIYLNQAVALIRGEK